MKQANIDPIEYVDNIHLPTASPGQHFHMDFGFVCGKEFVETNRKGQTITSIDGMRAY